MPPALKPTQQQILALAQRAQQLLGAGQPHEAVRVLAPAIDHAGKMPRVLLVYAQALGMIGQHERSAEMYRAATKQLPSDAHARAEYALMLKRCGRYDPALEQVRRSRERDPAPVRAVNLEAEVLMDLGRHGEALAALDAYEAQFGGSLTAQDRAQLLSTRARLAPRHIPAEPVAEELARFARDGGEVRPMQRAIAASRAAMLFDGLARYDEAFEMMGLCRSLRATPWNAGEHTARTEAMIRAWTSPEAAQLPRSDADGSGLVFIVGMPRSGTSLLEQMLGRHPLVTPTGERNDLLQAARLFHPPRPDQMPMVSDLSRFTPENVSRVGTELAGAIRSRLERGKTFVVDKQPFNFLCVPMIARLLPGARVLHTVRDGRDTCLSYHMQWFNGPHGQSNSMETLGRYYADYRRTMDAWRSLPAPEQRPEMLDVAYEELVADPERVMRGVLEFLGLAFDPAVLSAQESGRVVATASRDQVKSAIYTTSVAKWKRYERHLGPFLAHAGKYFEGAESGS